MAIKEIYSLPHPYNPDGAIEVYGDSDNGWYEWRVLGKYGVQAKSHNAMYGVPEIALRDALIAASE